MAWLRIGIVVPKSPKDRKTGGGECFFKHQGFCW